MKPSFFDRQVRKPICPYSSLLIIGTNLVADFFVNKAAKLKEKANLHGRRICCSYSS